MQDYTYTLKHTSGVENKVANALSRLTCVLKQLNTEVVGFKRIKEEYASCPDFGEIFGALKEGVTPEIDGSYSRMTIYFDFTRYVFPVHFYDTILFGSCMPGALPVTSDERRA